MLQSVEAAAREAGFFVTVANLETITPSSVHDAIEVFEKLGTDGAVVIAPHEAASDALEGGEMRRRLRLCNRAQARTP